MLNSLPLAALVLDATALTVILTVAGLGVGWLSRHWGLVFQLAGVAAPAAPPAGPALPATPAVVPASSPILAGHPVLSGLLNDLGKLQPLLQLFAQQQAAPAGGITSVPPKP